MILWYILGYSGEDSFVTIPVLNVVSKSIGKDWKELSKELGHKPSLWANISLYFKGTDEPLQETFKILNHKILWKDLKQALQNINREDIITIIEKKKIITLGK